MAINARHSGPALRPASKWSRAGIAALSVLLLGGCAGWVEFGDQRRVHDLYPEYTEPPSNRNDLDLRLIEPTAEPDVIE